MNRVLIDTSVWIEFFKANPLYFETFLDVIDRAQIFSIELIFAELMQGAKGKREIEMIDRFFGQMIILDSPGLIYQAGIFSRENKLLDRGIGLIDSIIISTSISLDLEIWTLDKKILGFVDKKYVFSGFR
ncbi:PIN domain-containing protein [Algoriphagus sp. D3-2-R+10]|uniref:PIN domain-containing protein n=1 Tax=Algoriphagus aurantiacus TaxID=3103948 RepID=UPI002B3AAB68|nr:PIN domain-containing protein [Algoriphagus sp. D3-2-R+10]MEB2777727.1 PIN domain-containing protein [Algoriphagus sp. D3-2-R+10]